MYIHRQHRRLVHRFNFLEFLPLQEWIDRANNYQPAGKPKKPIQQFDLNINLIAEYNSAADAGRALNKKDKSNICRAARKDCKAYNSYWKYKIDK